MYKYTHFIRQNIAPRGAERIVVYRDGAEVTTIPLGRMTPPTGEPNYRFGLLSDIHIYPIAAVAWTPEVKFENALTYFENEGCAFCVQCGDFTQTGLYLNYGDTEIDLRQFAKYKEICGNHPNLPVYGLCGNHESIQGVPITNNLTELEYYTGHGLYYTVSQGNDLFILIGQPNYNIVMGSDAFAWLSTVLADNTDKRCFVFIHSYIEEDSGDPGDLRENSVFDDWGAANTSAFMALLRQYENVVLFHGHSHTKFQCQEFDVNANYTERNGFKSVHVPSLGTPRDLDLAAGKTVDDPNASQGYVVDVYSDCLVLTGMDFVANKPIPLGVYKIEI